MARKTKEDTEHTYHQLLDAATLLFIEHGVAKTTLNDIAQRAGMTRGAVYWHFTNKDAVIKALWERNAGTAHHSFTHSLRNLDPQHPIAHFRQLIKSLLHNVISDPKLSQAMRIIMHCIEFSDEKTDLQQFLYRFRDDFYDALHTALTTLAQYHALRDDMNAAVLTSSLWAYINGLIHTHLEPDSKTVDLQQHYAALLDLWLNAALR